MSETGILRHAECGKRRIALHDDRKGRFRRNRPCIHLTNLSQCEAMNRPKGLALTAILMSICNIMPWATIRPGRPPYTLRTSLAFTVIIGIGFVFIWFYWQGRNWARISVLLYSILNILNLRVWNRISLSPGVLTAPTHVMMAAKAALGVLLLYWLSTRPVREFFTQDQANFTGSKDF